MTQKTKYAAGLVVAALTATILAAACGSGSNSYGTSSPPASPQASSSGTAGALRVEQFDYRFQPNSLTAETGKQVTVELVNSGSTAHTFTIDELGVDKTLDPGQTVTATFTPTKGGTFTFYCRFHRNSGMTGKLIVSGGSSSPSVSPSPVSSGATPSGGYGSGY